MYAPSASALRPVVLALGVVLLVAGLEAAVVPPSSPPDVADGPIKIAAAAAATVPSPEVPVEPEVAKLAAAPAVSPSSAPPVPPAPPAPPASDGQDKKMAAMVAEGSKPQAGNGTSGAISFQVLPPLLPKCSDSAECVSMLGQHSSCVDYWCACVDGSAYDSGFSKKCLLARKVVGDSCKENGDCRVANTYCKAGGCHCTAGFVFSDDGARCLPVATVENPSCVEPRQCVIMLQSPAAPTGPAVCVEGRCRCRYDYEHANGTCVAKQARGKACSQDVECADLEGGACVQNVCSCKEQFVPAVAANKCLPVVQSEGTSCEEDIQCSEGLGDLARCASGRCGCVEGALVGADKKCACGEGEELRKAMGLCEKVVPSVQQQQTAAKEPQAKKGGAASLQAWLPAVILLSLAASL